MTDGFESIWNGAKYRGLRSSLNTEAVAPACRDCEYLLR